MCEREKAFETNSIREGLQSGFARQLLLGSAACMLALGCDDGRDRDVTESERSTIPCDYEPPGAIILSGDLMGHVESWAEANASSPVSLVDHLQSVATQRNGGGTLCTARGLQRGVDCAELPEDLLDVLEHHPVSCLPLIADPGHSFSTYQDLDDSHKDLVGWGEAVSYSSQIHHDSVYLDNDQNINDAAAGTFVRLTVTNLCLDENHHPTSGPDAELELLVSYFGKVGLDVWTFNEAGTVESLASTEAFAVSVLKDNLKNEPMELFEKRLFAEWSTKDIWDNSPFLQLIDILAQFSIENYSSTPKKSTGDPAKSDAKSLTAKFTDSKHEVTGSGPTDLFLVAEQELVGPSAVKLVANHPQQIILTHRYRQVAATSAEGLNSSGAYSQYVSDFLVAGAVEYPDSECESDSSEPNLCKGMNPKAFYIGATQPASSSRAPAAERDFPTLKNRALTFFDFALPAWSSQIADQMDAFGASDLNDRKGNIRHGIITLVD